MKTKNRMNLGLLSFVACFTAAPAWAANITVGPTENYTYHNIQDAITNAAALDTITVYTGTYAGNLTLNKALTITGSNVVVDGDVTFGAAVTMNGVTVKNDDHHHHSHVVTGGSIQTALNATLAGGTVEVAADTYAGDLSITKALTLTGTSAVVNGNVTFGAAVTMTGVTVQNDNSCDVVPGGSIQTALDAALAGGTVTVATGTYACPEGLSLNKALTIDGDSAVVDGNVSFGAAVTMTGVTVLNDHSCNVVSGGSIQTAVNAALAGGTVTAVAGTYAEELDITKNLTLTGAGSGTTFINAPATVSTHTRNASETPRILVAVESATVTISGFTIDGLKRADIDEAYWGVNFWNSSGTLQNCTVKGFMHDTTDKSVTKYGVHVNQTTSGTMTQTVTITGNDVNTNGTGISLDATITTMTGITAHNNSISSNIVYGIRNSTELDVSATLNYWGAISGPGNFGSGNAVSTHVNFSPWWTNVERTTRDATDYDVTADTTTITNEQTYDHFDVPTGKTVTVSPTGRLAAKDLLLADGATLIVNGGVLALGDGSVISGTFTIFNNFGSWDINGDTTFRVNQSLSLITDIHIKAGKTVTVTGGGELILDGCVIDSQTPGTPYNITAATTGLLTIARCVVTDATIDINTTVSGNRKSRVYDNSFTTSDIEASAAAMVYHNLFDGPTNTAANSDTPATGAFAAIDGWANVTDAAYLQNKFTLDFAAPSATGRTLDANGNLFVHSGDAVVMTMDVAVLGENNITAAEALLGYNSAMLTLPISDLKVTPNPLTTWEVLEETRTTVHDAYGLVDSSLGLEFAGGNNTAGTIAQVNFTAGDLEGHTVGFFRVQTNRLFNPDGTLVNDTRLTGPQNTGFPLVSAFTANTGELVIDNQAPTIAAASAHATQVHVNDGTVDVLDDATAYVFRNEDGTSGNGKPVIMTFTATDAGDAGLETATGLADADLVLTASNDAGLTSLAYTVTASGTTTVTYTVTFTVPVTATNGTYEVRATVRDRSGNVSALADLGSFQIANEVLAAVQLQGLVATSRDVTFVATSSNGTILKTWTPKTVTFAGAVGSVPLEAVPAGTTAISAKTAWNLRSKLPVSFSGVGVGAVALTGDDRLPGGDLNGDNVVNTRDYAVLQFHWGTTDPTADIDGNGQVTTGDYDMLNYNFYTFGEAE